MAFVNEKIPEADKEMFMSFNLKNMVTYKPLVLWEWTIDRERDVFLVPVGGQGYYTSEIPMFYALIWNKNIIMMETFSKGIGKYSTGIEMWWKISKIRAPESLLKVKDELMELIKEAFDAYGFSGRRDCVTKVNFDFIATPWFVQEGTKS